MTEFFNFLWHCIRMGWEVGDGVFGWVEKITFSASAVFLFRKGFSKHRKKWEEAAMKAAFCILLGTFLLSTLFIAPFSQYRQSEHTRTLATASVARLSKTVDELQSKVKALEESEQERARQREATRIAGIEESARQRDKMLIQAATNTSPLRGMLSVIANEDPGAPSIEGGKPFDLASSGAALSARLNKFDAQESLNRMDATEADATAIKICSAAFDYFITTLRRILTDLAAANGDTVFSDYIGMPKFVKNGAFAFTGMETNKGWGFTMSLRGCEVNGGLLCMDIYCVPKPGTSPVNATLQFAHSSKTLQSRLNFSGKIILIADSPISDYKTNIDNLLTLMVAAQNMQIPIANVRGKASIR